MVVSWERLRSGVELLRDDAVVDDEP